jgi:hypothetical protein
MNPLEQWTTRDGLDRQVFALVMDGNLTYTEVRSFTNAQRRDWLKLLTERAKKQKEAMDQAKRKK